MTQLVQQHTVTLRGFHDLIWVDDWGRVFRVFDQRTDGTLGFGTELHGRRLYLRYAGAPTIGYAEDPALAVERLRNAAPHYQAVPHAALQRITQALPLPHGFLCVFDWLDGFPLAPIQENHAHFRAAPLTDRLRMFDMLLDLHVRLEEQGLVAAGVADANLLYDAAGTRLVVTAIEDYLVLPATNVRGRVPGSPYYLAPECYQRTAALDETTTVYAMGGLAHCFFGERRHKSRDAWQAPARLYDVAARALLEDRNLRYQSTSAMQQAWRQAVMQASLR